MLLEVGKGTCMHPRDTWTFLSHTCFTSHVSTTHGAKRSSPTTQPTQEPAIPTRWILTCWQTRVFPQAKLPAWCLFLGQTSDFVAATTSDVFHTFSCLFTSISTSCQAHEPPTHSLHKHPLLGSLGRFSWSSRTTLVPGLQLVQPAFHLLHLSCL